VYSYAIATDTDTGWHKVSISVTDPSDSSRNVTATIVPECGSNLCSIVVGGTEMIYTQTRLSTLINKGWGIPVLYPTPNRTTDGKYMFMGQQYNLAFPGEKGSHSLHGLVVDDVWQYSEPKVTRDGVEFKTWYVFNDANPRFPGFPFKNTLTLTFTVAPGTVRVAYTVENQDTKPLGFGFGLHPYWRTQGTREQVRVQVDLPWHMDATRMFPSGKLDATAGSTWDLTTPKQVSTLSLDDVFFGATPQSTVKVFFDAIGLTLTQHATEDFTHVVVYTPRANYLCVENQTCSTDAFNLTAKGFVKESHLQTVQPGSSASGHIEYLFDWKK
jgi:aldose 1-epimerase